MMFTTNNVFIDSSLLVEYIKGTKIILLNELIGQEKPTPSINETVVSEFLLYFLTINANASPRTLKNSARISSIFGAYSNYDLLERFYFLSTDDKSFSLVPGFMAN